jgi:hypothetical protein
MYQKCIKNVSKIQVLRFFYFSDTNESTITEYPCFNCDVERRAIGFPNLLGLREHLEYKHEPPEGQALKAMQKRGVCRPSLPSQSPNESMIAPPRRVLGIENTSGLVGTKDLFI